MKRFVRSVVGKTTLFILFSLTMSLVLASLAAGSYMLRMGFYEITEEFYESERVYIGYGWGPVVDILYSLRFWLLPICIGSAILATIIFVILMCSAGKRYGSEEIVPGLFSKIPFDAILVIAAACMVLYMLFVSFFHYELQILLECIGLVIACNLLLGLCMCFSARVKMHRLWGELIIVKASVMVGKALGALGKWIISLYRQISSLWKVVLIFASVSVAELLGILIFSRSNAFLLILWIIEKEVLFIVTMYMVLSARKVQKAADTIAEGNLNYQMNAERLPGMLRLHGESLNAISRGMRKAVEEQTKSEKMKTELITNVSHDLKTPLTSLINYASLIGSESTDNEKIREYSEVIVRQSAKLKRLMEDLIEAAKASSGTLEILPAPCSAEVFISQAGGEYQDKIQSADLTLVTSCPDYSVPILADSRRMWRIFDNLMNNICKYSQPGTRVYLSLKVSNYQAIITFKNTSRNPLNVSADELQARFVRGDSSRNTEGNGLGLSIVRSLTELQGGSFLLEVDGDLFKVTLAFPLYLQ